MTAKYFRMDVMRADEMRASEKKNTHNSFATHQLIAYSINWPVISFGFISIVFIAMPSSIRQKIGHCFVWCDDQKNSSSKSTTVAVSAEAELIGIVQTKETTNAAQHIAHLLIQLKIHEPIHADCVLRNFTDSSHLFFLKRISMHRDSALFQSFQSNSIHFHYTWHKMWNNSRRFHTDFEFFTLHSHFSFFLLF